MKECVWGSVIFTSIFLTVPFGLTGGWKWKYLAIYAIILFSLIVVSYTCTKLKEVKVDKSIQVWMQKHPAETIMLWGFIILVSAILHSGFGSVLFAAISVVVVISGAAYNFLPKSWRKGKIV